MSLQKGRELARQKERERKLQESKKRAEDKRKELYKRSKKEEDHLRNVNNCITDEVLDTLYNNAVTIINRKIEQGDIQTVTKIKSTAESHYEEMFHLDPNSDGCMCRDIPRWDCGFEPQNLSWTDNRTIPRQFKEKLTHKITNKFPTAKNIKCTLNFRLRSRKLEKIWLTALVWFCFPPLSCILCGPIFSCYQCRNMKKHGPLVTVVADIEFNVDDPQVNLSFSSNSQSNSDYTDDYSS